MSKRRASRVAFGDVCYCDVVVSCVCFGFECVFVVFLVCCCVCCVVVCEYVDVMCG